ncbi:hypothetical protein Tco_0370030 [Tanacetum coccineum]
MPPKRNSMSTAAIERLISQPVANALLNYEANRNSGNENGNGNGNGNDNGNGSRDSGSGNRRTLHTACGCTYKEFLNCQPLNFKGTKGAVGLAHWFEKMEYVFHISNCDVECQVKSEIKKLETELWNLKVKGTDVESYTQRFQELVLLCSRMVPDESDKVERSLIDQKVRAYAARQGDNKRRMDNNPGDNHAQQPPYKRHNVARSYTTGPSEKKEYAGTLLLCNK